MANTEWQLSGNMAERYEEFLVPVVFVPWARDLLARAALKPGERLLDLACGTGIVARMAAGTGVSVIGADLNPGMLEVAVDRAEGTGIVFQQADAQDLPFHDSSFDVIICQQGLQFFPDKARALAECFRVLRPGGRAVFCIARGLDENPLMQAQVAAIERHIGEAATGAIRAVCGFGDPDEASAVFADAGFAPIATKTVVLELKAKDAMAFVDGLMKSTPVADSVATMDSAERSQMLNTVLDGFGDYRRGQALSFPHSSNVVEARRPD